MKSPEIKLGSWWIYTGEDDAEGTRHQVIDVDSNEIITWSDPKGQGGFSWLGPLSEFKKNFKAE